MTTAVWTQEILIPSSSVVKDRAIFSNGNKAIVGNGFFPVSYTEANRELPKKDSTRGWIVRKIFDEHFIQQSGDDFYLAVDPLVGFSIGKEILQNPPYRQFQNTRGAQAFGHIKNKFSFYTAFYENQARFIKYQSDYFKSRGELYPNSDGTYNRQNAVVPGGGRTKPFKTNGYDYASAISYVRFTPIEQLAVQFGNAPRFFGWGHRSMLLSDNAYNYTHLSIDWEIFDGLSYTLMRGKQLNLNRKVYTEMVESPYERKGLGVQYLSYEPMPSLVIGLFESSVYLRDAATNSQRANPYFYRPIIGVNTAVNGAETSDMKQLFGLNLAWQFHPEHLLYAQAVSDDLSGEEYGLQLGYRTGNTFEVKDLFFQIEANVASSRLYAAQNQRMNYTHFNMPLAHTLGNGFKELLVRAGYQIAGVFIDVNVVYYEAEQPIQNNTQLFASKLAVSTLDQTKVSNTNIAIGYEFNRATQLRMFLNLNYRTRKSASGEHVNYGTASIGIRSALTNQYSDF